MPSRRSRPRPADAAASGAAPNGLPAVASHARRGRRSSQSGSASSRFADRRTSSSARHAAISAGSVRSRLPASISFCSREQSPISAGNASMALSVRISQRSARQRPARHRLNPVRLEADHVELPARAEHVGERGEAVAGREQDAQAVQPRQVVRQCGQRIAGEVEHFERVGEIEDRAREFRQPACELELPCAGELAGLQLFEGVCHAGKTGGGCDDRRVDRPNSTGIACVHSPILSHPFTNAQRRARIAPLAVPTW